MEYKIKYTDNWNLLIYIRDNKKTPFEIKHHAEMLLSSLNTAGGKELMKCECDSFIETNRCYA